MQSNINKVIQEADARFDDAIEQIARLVGFGGVSQGGPEGPTGENVLKLADAILEYLQTLPDRERPSRCRLHGLPRNKTVENSGAFPVIIAEWWIDDDLPTLLVYGHADSVPVNADEWKTMPFEAVVLEENGEKRLYGRGASDDLGGWMTHLVAIQAYLSVCGKLPLNVRLLIEFEEEIGSPNLMAHLDELGDFSEVDAMVLTDCENPSTTTPGLTVSLRGLATADVVCSTSRGGHSGLHGSVLADPSLALVTVLGRLVDVDGRPNFGLVELTDEERRHLDGVTSVEATLPRHGRSNAEWAWRQTGLTITGTTLPDLNLASSKSSDVPKPTNVIRQRAAARLSIRVPPGRTADGLLGEVAKIVTASPPPGIEVALEPVQGAMANVDPWLYEVPDCVAFEVVDRAYTAAWGMRPIHIGVGGSIPFVKQFGDRFGGKVPLILNGVLDPDSELHAANESLHLGVFRKAIHANVHLLAGLGALPKGGFLAPPGVGSAVQA